MKETNLNNKKRDFIIDNIIAPWIFLIIVFVVIGFVVSALNGFKSLTGYILEYGIIGIIIGFFVINLMILRDKLFGPRKRKTFTRKSPLIKLNEIGFQLQGDTYSGVYKNFYCEVSFWWPGIKRKEKGFEIVIYYKRENQDLKQLNDKYYQEDYCFYKDHVVAWISYKIIKPRFKEILDSLDELNDILETGNFKTDRGK